CRDNKIAVKPDLSPYIFDPDLTGNPCEEELFSAKELLAIFIDSASDNSFIDCSCFDLSPNSPFAKCLKDFFDSSVLKDGIEPAFAKRVIEVLKFAIKNGEFRQIFDQVISDRTCADGALFVLDKLELYKRILEAGGLKEGPLIHLFKTVFVEELLRKMAN